MFNFNNSTFYYEPFPHCVLDEFLDASFYKKICSEFPELDIFEELKNNKEDKKFKKYRLSNSNTEIKKFNKFINSTTALKKLYNYFNTDQFLISLNNYLLKNHIDLRLDVKKNSNFKSFFRNIFLKKKKIDFEFSSIPLNSGFILPHTDGENKILSFVIPIIDDEEILKSENLGTKIYKSKSNKYKFNLYNKTVPLNDIELVRELPFKKNQLSIHVKTFNSLHGVGPFQNKNKDESLMRKSISVFILK